jgi:hypothetical protein
MFDNDEDAKQAEKLEAEKLTGIAFVNGFICGAVFLYFMQVFAK